MKENSIEKTLENIQNVDLITLLRKFKKEGVKNFIVIRRNNFDEILDDQKINELSKKYKAKINVRYLYGRYFLEINNHTVVDTHCIIDCHEYIQSREFERDIKAFLYNRKKEDK